MLTPADYARGALDRHQGLLTAAEQIQLGDAVVCAAGVGGVGGGTCLTLARMGCRTFRVADCGDFDASNGNRQTGCIFNNVGRNKAVVVAEMIREVNPVASVDVHPEGVTDANAERLVRGSSVVLDGIDLYAMSAKKRLYGAARAEGLPVVSTPIFGFGAAVAVFDPVRSPDFETHFGAVPDPTDTQAYRRYLQRIAIGFFGLVPALDWKTFAERAYVGKCPSIGSSCMLAAAVGSVAVMDCILKRQDFPVVPETIHIDLRHLRLIRVGRLRRLAFKLRLAAALWHAR
jgi:molybdopterin/thiamine biosynthesis adenylyltransferase